MRIAVVRLAVGKHSSVAGAVPVRSWECSSAGVHGVGRLLHRCVGWEASTGGEGADVALDRLHVSGLG